MLLQCFVGCLCLCHGNHIRLSRKDQAEALAKNRLVFNVMTVIHLIGFILPYH
jgi:hypothetical protein